MRIKGELFTFGSSRGQTYFESQLISKLFNAGISPCKIQSFSLVKDEEGAELDDSAGLGILTYDTEKDMILVDRTIKLGKFDLFVQGRINENMTVHHPVQVELKEYYNPAPGFEALAEGAVREPMYLYIELDETAIAEERTETKTIESPLVIDGEGDAIIFEF